MTCDCVQVLFNYNSDQVMEAVNQTVRGNEL